MYACMYAFFFLLSLSGALLVTYCATLYTRITHQLSHLHSPTLLFTHCIQSLQSLHSFIAIIHCIRSLIASIHSLIQSLIYSLIHSFTHTFKHTLIAFITFIAFIHCIHLFISFTHTFIHTLRLLVGHSPEVRSVARSKRHRTLWSSIRVHARSFRIRYPRCRR